MSKQPVSWQEIIDETPDAKFDNRLIEKKVDEHFLTQDQADSYLKSIPDEKEFDFSYAEELDKEQFIEDDR